MTTLMDLGYFWNKAYLTAKKKNKNSVFSYTLAYPTLKYERNWIFHPCHGMFGFYGQALFKPEQPRSLFMWD